MSSDDEGGEIIAVGLLGLLVGAVLVAGSGGARESLPARREPKLLPRNPPVHPPARRVYEWYGSGVDEYEVTHSIRSYAPTDSPTNAPWVVTAWYDATRNAEIIRVEFSRFVQSTEVKFAVRWGKELDPDRIVFRRGAPQLWPDDKWNDRVVYRYKESAVTGCFLVEVTVDGETIDFYHESERAIHLQTTTMLLALADMSPDPGSQSRDDFKKYRALLEEIRLERTELEASALHSDDKKELAKFLDQRTRKATATYLSNLNSIDFLTPRR